MKRLLIPLGLLFLLVLTPPFQPTPSEAQNSNRSVPLPSEPIEQGLFANGEIPSQDEFLRSAARLSAFKALTAKAKIERSVRVIVGLRVATYTTEGELKDVQEVEAQRESIAQAQRLLLERLSGSNVSLVREFEFIPFMAMAVDLAALQQLEIDGEVVSIEEDIALPASLAESTSLIGAPTAWSAGFSGAGQTVAILDTGVDKTHSFLTGKVISEACYSSNFSNSSSVCPGGVTASTSSGSGVNCSNSITGCNHGTHVAGIAAGKGNSFSGVAKDANIIAVQVFSRFDSSVDCKNAPTPCARTFSSDQLLGLQRVYALRNTYDIAAVNMSLGGNRHVSACDAVDPSYKAAIDNLRTAGIATVIASGNDSYKDAIAFPACISSAISVGSTGDGSSGATQDLVVSDSNSASFLTLLAPGRWINSSIPNGGFANFTGTSMAAPHVAGAWAVIKSKKPTATVDEILTALRTTGLNVTDTNGITKPRIRLDAAINAIGGSCSYALTPTSQSFAASGGSSSFNVTTSAGCPWAAVSNANWLTTTSTGSGNGSVNFVVAANTGAARSATIAVGGQSFTVNQSAGSGGGCPTTTISVGQTINGTLTTSDCIFTGTTRYVDVYSFSGTAGQQIFVTMNSNFDTFLYLVNSSNQILAQDDDGGGGTNSRIPAISGFFTLPATGTYTIYATSFSSDGVTGSTGAYSFGLGTVSCTYTLSPTSRSFGAPGGSDSFSMTAPSGCSWSAVSNASWIATTSSGFGNGNVSYVVASNSGAARTSTITVAGRTFTVSQAAGGGSCPSTTISFGQSINATLNTSDCVFTGTTRYVDVYNFSGTTGQQIAVSMNSNFDTFIYLLNSTNQLLAQDDDGGDGTNSRIPSTSGFFTLPASGSYTLYATSYSADGITGSTGAYTISLLSGSCSYSLNPTSQSFGASAGSGSFSVGTSAGCAWSAVSNASWLTTTSSGSGNGTVNFGVAANTGAARSASITVNGQIFTATQSGASALTVQFASSGSAITETLNATTKVNISVTRAGSTAQAASVDYATANGTASERSDYLATFGTLHFAAGETTKIIPVFIVDDRFGEGPETFTISLSDPVGCTLGSPTAFTVTINSNESVNGLNPVKDASFSSDFFVRQQYVDFFNREADAGGLGFWKNQIDSCSTQACRDSRKVNVSAAFFVSIEFQETGYLVYKAYQAAFNSGEFLRLRDFLPDTQEIGRGVVIGQPGADAQLEANKVAFFNDFVQRPAFVALANYPTTMTAAQFVDKLNANTYDPRNPGGGSLTQSQRDALVAQLAPNPFSPVLRAQVLRAVAQNSIFTQRQFNKAFVLMQYFGYLRRNPNDPPEVGLNFGGYNFWLGKLNQFNGNYISAEMVKAFITSGEYEQRFGP